MLLTGRNPFYLMPLEQKRVLQRTRFECHGPALPGIYLPDVTLCIDHLAHPDGGDDVNFASDRQPRTKSLLIE